MKVFLLPSLNREGVQKEHRILESSGQVCDSQVRAKELLSQREQRVFASHENKYGDAECSNSEEAHVIFTNTSMRDHMIMKSS